MYYNSGIGTYVKGSKIRVAFDTRGVLHVADLLFAMYVLFRDSTILCLSVSCPDGSSLLFVRRNFKEKVLKAYEWLSENYEPGDRIFLFGHPSSFWKFSAVTHNYVVRFLSRRLPSSCYRGHDREGEQLS